jgi:AcrR family transcriptional regulator
LGTKERREREKAATRQLILDSAREIFVNEGSEGLTMRRLAEAIEYSPTAIYNHFEDREAILTELSICDFAEFTKRFDLVPRDAPPLDRLRLLGRAYIAFAQQNVGQYRHLFCTPREISAEALAAKPQEDAYDILLTTVKGAIASGDFHDDHDPDVTAQVLWGALHGIVTLHLFFAKGGRVELKPLEALAEATMDRLVAGFQLPPATGITEPQPRAKRARR